MPFNPTPRKPRTKEEALQDALRFGDEQLKNEIDRGNSLCEIIYKMVEGIPLEMHELRRIANIIRNTELRNQAKPFGRHVSEIENMDTDEEPMPKPLEEDGA